jgi:hypothetical protein
MSAVSGQDSGAQIFPKIYEQIKNSRRPKGDMKHIPYWRCTNIRRHCAKFSRHGGLAQPSVKIIELISMLLICQ